MNKPKIRFKGFEGEWKERRIGDICNVSTGKSNTQDKVDDGKFPFYVRSPHIEKSNKYLYDEEAVLTVGDGVGTGKVFHYVNGKYDLHQRVYRLYDFKGVNALCFYYYFSQKFYKRVMAMTAKSSVDSVRLDFISEMHLPFPSLPEQRALASYFTSLDAQIAASTSRLSSLKQIKAASLLNMFPQKGETVPRVRFKGFQGEWKERKLGEVFSERVENNINEQLLSVTLNKGIIRASENGKLDNSNSDKSKYKVVNINDIAYNSMRMWQGASGCSKYEGIVSPAYTVITPKEDIDSSFFSYLFKTDIAINKFRLHSQGLTSDNWNLKYPAFSKIDVYCPLDISEQRAIASFFTALDAQITLHRKRLEKLKQIKAACLEKMFA